MNIEHYDFMDQLRTRQGALSAGVIQLNRTLVELEKHAGPSDMELHMVTTQLRTCLEKFQALDEQISMLCDRIDMDCEIYDMPEIYGPPSAFY